MSSAASRSEILAARDGRHAQLLEVLEKLEASAVTLALNIPGPNKTPPGSEELFRWARRRLLAALPSLREVIAGTDRLGPFAVFAGPVPAKVCKELCMQIEESRPAARLVDLDVYDTGGRHLDRTAAGHPTRPCLLCSRPAVECIRLKRHSPAALEKAADELLSLFRS